MTPEQQRIAIAESCGWTEIEPCTCCYGVSRGYQPIPAAHKKHLPDFINDLNACHEMEKVLRKANWGGYAAELYRITDAHNHGISPNHHWLAVAFSTASQRAEAFLRTIGKWEEAK
jgi:hypothetical protein